MANIFDVADWFLAKQSMTPKKLQKLCYYYKAWGLALYDKDLLPESQFQAWVHGPVNPELYKKYKDFMWRKISKKRKDNSQLFSSEEIDLLASVWLTYGELSANALEVQTHLEQPWRNARKGVDEFSNCSKVISNNDIKNFYRTVYQENQGK